MITASFLQALRKANAQLELLFRRYCGVLPFGRHEELRMLIRVEHALRDIGLGMKLDPRVRQRPDVQREMILYWANLLRLQRELRSRERLALSEYRQKQLTRGRVWRTTPTMIQ